MIVVRDIHFVAHCVCVQEPGGDCTAIAEQRGQGEPAEQLHVHSAAHSRQQGLHRCGACAVGTLSRHQPTGQYPLITTTLSASGMPSYSLFEFNTLVHAFFCHAHRPYIQNTHMHAQTHTHKSLKKLNRIDCNGRHIYFN